MVKISLAFHLLRLFLSIELFINCWSLVSHHDFRRNCAQVQVEHKRSHFATSILLQSKRNQRYDSALYYQKRPKVKTIGGGDTPLDSSSQSRGRRRFQIISKSIRNSKETSLNSENEEGQFGSSSTASTTPPRTRTTTTTTTTTTRNATGNHMDRSVNDFTHSNEVTSSTNDNNGDELTSSDASYFSIRTKSNPVPVPAPASVPSSPPPLNQNDKSNDPNSDGLWGERVPGGTVLAEKLDTAQFGSIFRQCAPYIAMHRGAVMVVHIGAHVHAVRQAFDEIMDDISILHLLGVQVVLVAGVRSQLDERLKNTGNAAVYKGGMRVTDEESMRALKELSGYVRFEIESSLARGFRGRPGQSGINVVSGNFFYTAKPLGVRDGVDFKFTGEVRRIEVDNLKKRLDSGDIVMLTSLGYSPSGEVFNVPSESLAAEVAARLKAAKIIYLTDGESLVDTRTEKPVQSLRLAQAISILDSYGIARSDYNQIESETIDTSQPISTLSSALDPNPVIEEKELVSTSSLRRRRRSSSLSQSKLNSNNSSISSGSGISSGISNGNNNNNSNNENRDGNSSLFVHYLARCVHALLGGVRRAHLVPPQSGAILKELYTRDGAGILISRDVYEGIRQAQASDVRAVEEIIKPLEAEGILVPRSREQLEKDMNDCFLLTRDGTTLACGMLKRYGDSHAEVCCLAVHPSYRKEGRGETLLAYLERRALLLGVSDLFVLSTRTMQWFEERGFVLSDPELLPPTRAYNASRGSKVYIKKMLSQRDVDAEELLWNV